MLAVTIIAIVLASINVVLEFKRDLMMLQQNSYRNERYNRWLSTSHDTTSTMRLVSGAVVLAALSTLSVPIVSTNLISLVCIVNIFILAGKKYKKPLVMTRRAWRILSVMLLLAAIVLAIVIAFCVTKGYSLDFAAIYLLLIYCFSHLFLLAANYILKPVEKHIYGKYYKDAQRILESMPDLKIIGVTGSEQEQM